MKLKCIIVDDEQLAIMVLESYLKRIPNIDIVRTFNTALPVYNFLQENEIDLIFLDIEMPDITGLDFVKTLTIRPFIIFTTARKDYAIEGFELNVVDYIVKPISFERLLKSINRVLVLKANKQSIETKAIEQNVLFLKENKKNIKVNITDILYFESIKDYVKVVTKNKTVITKQQLGNFENKLVPESFLRVHRSFIVMIEHIDAFTCADIEIGEHTIPIGRNYKEEVLERLEQKCS